MRICTRVLACLIAAALLAPGPAFAGTTGKIEGRITDQATGQPLALANVQIVGATLGANTDDGGRYFIINVPAGRYDLRASYVGFKETLIRNVTVIADFSTTIDVSLQPTAIEVGTITVEAVRPLIQRDATATTRFITSDEIQNLPTRGYLEAAALQTGVVQYRFVDTGAEASNNPSISIRGGRQNETAYFVDGFSQQDPLTGNSTTSINQNAIDQIVVSTGGFNAEYGRIMSGAVNVITKEGKPEYFGSIEAYTDNLSGEWMGTDRYDNNVYDIAFGGPIAPGRENLSFYMSGERRWNGDRLPRSLADESYDGGSLPNNELAGWTWQGKVAWKPANNMDVKVGTLGSFDDWREYRNSYRLNIEHTPRYQDTNRSVFASATHVVNQKTFQTLSANYFYTMRKRGDGVCFDDLKKYARPGGNPDFDSEITMFWLGDDPATPDTLDQYGQSMLIQDPDDPSVILYGDESSLWDDYFQRESWYLGAKYDIQSQVNANNLVKAGVDFQRHTLRLYNHYFPTRLYLEVDSTGVATYEPNTIDCDRYGYDTVITYDVVTGSAGQDSIVGYDIGLREVDGGRDGAKHPMVASAYVQDKFDYEGLVVNAGLRYDYLNVDTKALAVATRPLGDDAALDDEDLRKNKVYHRVSPRLGVGFPVTDATLLHANYGVFYQQPNLEDLYVSYAFLEHKTRTGGYYVPFGNPNLEPEATTAYEVGVAQQLGEKAKFDVTAYYKDVKNLVQVRNVPSLPKNFASYENTDFGTLKGVDFQFELRRTENLAANVAYSLSYANGTGSVSQTQQNTAWTSDIPPKQTAPLSFDQRHRITANVDYRLGHGQGPLIAGARAFQDAGINLLATMGSGFPYTPLQVYNEVTLAATSPIPIGPVNSRYGPWTYRFDLKADKNFRIGRYDLNAYVWILNLFDRDNPIVVYQASGSATSTNWLATNEGLAWLARNGEEGLDLYSLAERNPNNFDVPRMVRFGLRAEF
jgi:outer membrane receptor protein involved in Fe transport